MDTAIPIADTAGSEIAHSDAEWCLVLCLRAVAITGSTKLEDRAGTPFADLEADLQHRNEFSTLSQL